MPLTLIFLYQNRAARESYWFCHFWNILQYSFGSATIWVTMISSIEQYLFVFHSACLKRHFILLRILPLILSLFHPLIFQITLIVIAPPCTNLYRYEFFMCAFPCYVFLDFWSVFGWNIYVGIPIFIIVISNSILIGRVVKRKRRLQQSGAWPKVVKLIIQVVLMSLLGIIAWLPLYVAVELGRTSIKPLVSSSKSTIFTEYLVYLPYLVVNLCPFMCLIGLPELHQPLKDLIRYCYPCKQTRVPSLSLLVSGVNR